MEMGVIYLGNQFIKNLQPIETIGMTGENAKKLLEQNLPLFKQIKKEIFNKQPKCRSIALLPLFIRKNTFGILALASKKQIDFDEEKKQLLSAIGHQLAINIENAILFKELDEKVIWVVATRDEIEIPKQYLTLNVDKNISATQLREQVQEAYLDKNIAKEIITYYKDISLKSEQHP